MRLRPGAAALAVALILAAPASAADPIAGSLYEGATEEGAPLQFRVAPDGETVTDVVTWISAPCAGAQGGGEPSSLRSKAPFRVWEGTITGEDDATTPRLTMNGTFLAPEEASGVLTVSFETCERQVEWAARVAPAGGGGGGAPGGGAPGGGEAGFTPAPGSPPGPGTPPVGDPGAPTLTLVLPWGVRVKPALTRGWVVGGTVSGAATLAGQVTLPARAARRYRLGRKALVVARATAAVPAAGEFGLRFKPSRRVARRLRRARRLTLELAIDSTGADGARATTKRTITLGP